MALADTLRTLYAAIMAALTSWSQEGGASAPDLGHAALSAGLALVGSLPMLPNFPPAPPGVELALAVDHRRVVANSGKCAKLGCNRRAGRRFWADLAAVNDWSWRLHYAMAMLLPSPAYTCNRYRVG